MPCNVQKRTSFMRKITLPQLPIPGGCQCGAVRYEIAAPPVTFYLCHCTECQRHTSSAFGESLRLRRADLRIDGDLACFTRRSNGGSAREGHFCPQCGVRIVHGTTGSDMVNIKAGTLDDTSWLVPAGHIWVRSRQPFVVLPADDPVWQAQPSDNYAALIERWAAMIAAS